MAKKKARKKSKKSIRFKATSFGLSDEEVAYRLVKLYFEEIARMGFKRKLDLDGIINAYFYSLSRLKRKEAEIEAIKRLVLREEADLRTETKEQMFPVPAVKESKRKVSGTPKSKIQVKGTEYI